MVAELLNKYIDPSLIYCKMYCKCHFLCEVIYDPLLCLGKLSLSFLNWYCSYYITFWLYVFLFITKVIMSILKTETMSYLYLSFQAPSTMLHGYRIKLHKLSAVSLFGRKKERQFITKIPASPFQEQERLQKETTNMPDYFQQVLKHGEIYISALTSEYSLCSLKSFHQDKIRKTVNVFVQHPLK